jgi:hypothetical protein
MCDPGDEHAEHVAPQPAGGDGTPAAEYSRRLAFLEKCVTRYEQATNLWRDAQLELQKREMMKAICWTAVQDARLQLSAAAFSGDFDARGLRPGRLDRDPPVRLNRANNSWEET